MRLTRRMGPDYRASARGRLLRLFVWSSCLAAVLILRPFAAAQDARLGLGEDDPRIKTSAPIFFERVETVRVTPSGSLSDLGVRTASGDSCDQESTYTDADFDGPGDFSIVFGLAETEIFAASYTIAPQFFPIEILSVEMVFAQTGVEDTTTVLRPLIWDGTPESGTQLLQFPLYDEALILHSPDNAANFIIDLSAAPIEVSNLSETNTFSVGFQIIEHHNPSKNPCINNPPPNSNAFPTVDNDDVQNGADNWLFLVNCGPLACPAGWSRFEELALCEPEGDWVLRATWAPQSCEFLQGGCCHGDGTCTENEFDFVCEDQDGRFLGENVLCPVLPEICNGACCFPDGQCSVQTSDACAGLDGEYLTDGSVCVPDPCPDPIGACCNLGPDGDQCLDATDADCTNPKVDGVWQGGGTDCADANGNGVADDCEPTTGACCQPSGTCEDDTVAETCEQAGGNYKGDETVCAEEDCLGACCFGALCLLDASGSNCTDAGGTWYGPQISCNDEPNPCLVDPLDGACCLADGSTCQVLGEGDCSMVGDTWFGPGSSCDFIQCDQPTGACCAVGDPCNCQNNLTEEECTGAEGQWAGANTTCADNCETCEACCSPITGACVDLTAADCMGFGADPQGAESTCATTICPVVVGACCSDDGTLCSIFPQSTCAALAGNWQGPDTICEGLECSVTGACCFINETCAELQATACEFQGGEYLGNGTDCIPNPCGPVGCINDADCSDSNQCNGIETCVNDSCVSGTPLDCDDDDACTLDCDPAIGCVNEPIDCDDGDPCTDDACEPVGGCVNTLIDCDDSDACTDDSCDELGECVHDLIDCDDGDDCTEDGCDPGSGCVNTPFVPCCGNGEVEEGEDCDPPDGALCDDNCQIILTEACCIPDTASCFELPPLDCLNGGNVPQGPGSVCEPNPCPPPSTGACCLTDGNCAEAQTSEECDAVLGNFQGAGTTCAISECCFEDLDCDDADACNGAETCQDNVCQDADPLDCDDVNVCTNDACDPASGCVHDPIDCDDGDACTADDCDPVMGCTHTPIVPCCGNGKTEPGEQCDPPDGDVCGEDCQFLPTGACCFAVGNCEDDVSENACNAAGADWQGAGEICTPELCPPCTQDPKASENDCCVDAISISTGLSDFDTTNANTDGPEHPGECKTEDQTHNDIWYEYTADCTADTIVSTCEDLGAGADYDTKLVVYDGCECDNLVLLGCNDDDPDHLCGDNPEFHSTVTVPLVAGNCYLIRIGGWMAPDAGTGSLLIDPQCGACCQGDSCVENQGPGECEDAGGDYQGEGVTCGDINCTITGACCLAGGGCDEMTAQGCAEQAGDYQDDGTLCEPDPCGVGCEECLWDVFPIDGVVGSGDLAFLLGNWGPIPPDADPLVFCLDIDFDEIIGSLDLANLLGNWGPCQ